MSDFDFEPVRGLPERLPEGERLLWQGGPRWQNLAIEAFHARKALIYFAALAVLQGVAQLWSGYGLAEAARPFLWLLPMGAAAAGILTGLAYASARTTVYTITSKRIVMRIGIAIPVTINLPFKIVDSAAVKVTASGAGDISLSLNNSNRPAYLMFWPHVRPGNYARPQPCLRAIDGVERVAGLLANALQAAPLPRPFAGPLPQTEPEAVAA